MVNEKTQPGCREGMFCGQALLLLAFVLAIFLATPVLAGEQKYGLDLEWRPIPGVGEPVPKQDKPGEKPGEKESRRDAAPTVKTFTVKGVTFKMIRVPAEEFMMGSPADERDRDKDETQHRVKISRHYWLGDTEVTQGLWKAVMGDNPSHFKNCGDDCPVEQVSWNDCQEFIKRLNVAAPGAGFRLPTEAEWEYACRSGGKAELYCGGSDLDSLAWYDKNSGVGTHSVKQKRPNGLGLYDMSGNVWEWCEDWYGVPIGVCDRSCRAFVWLVPGPSGRELVRLRRELPLRLPPLVRPGVPVLLRRVPARGVLSSPAQVDAWPLTRMESRPHQALVGRKVMVPPGLVAGLDDPAKVLGVGTNGIARGGIARRASSYRGDCVGAFVCVGARSAGDD